jgi:hypothetical protein
MKEWSFEETNLLINSYNKPSKEELLKMFPKRTWCAVKDKALKLGLAKKISRWEKWETDWLIENYRSASKENILETLKRHSNQSIRNKASKLGLQRPNATNEHGIIKRELSDIEKGYIAGIIDGEGTISIRKGRVRGRTKYQPYLVVVNTDLTLIQYLISRLNLNTTTMKEKKTFPKNRKQAYLLSVRGKTILPLLKAIEPLLVVKKRQCLLVAEWIESRLNRATYNAPYSNLEIELYEEVKRLNTKGVL